MKVKYPVNKGFTLIELLVVMTIIAVLATFGFSAFGKAKEMANRTAAIANMKQIHLALTSYATDNNDAYPDKKTATEPVASSANVAFKRLIPSYISDEKAFAVKGSPSNTENDGNTETEAEKLKAGENHYAMALGLTSASNSNYPLIWEGGESGDDSYNPTWMKGKRDEWGGSWSDGSVLIVTVGGSVTQKKLDLPANAEAGEKASIVKDGSNTIFGLRTDGKGLAPEKGSSTP